MLGVWRRGKRGIQGTIDRSVQWSEENHMQLNLAKTKEIIVDYKKEKSPPSPVCISWSNVEMAEQYRYLGVSLDSKLEWSANTEAVYKKGLSWLYFLRRLRSFNVCNKLLYCIVYIVYIQCILCILYCIVCWGAGIKRTDANRLNKLIRKAHSVVGMS